MIVLTTHWNKSMNNYYCFLGWLQINRNVMSTIIILLLLIHYHYNGLTISAMGAFSSWRLVEKLYRLIFYSTNRYTTLKIRYKLLKLKACALIICPSDYHRKSISIEAGFSRYDFQRFENLAMDAPSMTLWSADQLTPTTWAL